ncbi:MULTISPECIES: hypothetical protein [unclassified Nodularia (in: cyanobacteria)]|uniref:hypothetical protein n=1 Tax=unclassified Nodularia (in: cyanobacteria) TaxID=2656917 RepID=UPI001880A155|nr:MULTISPECIES: hypothetical protein [unclassified Nodularia (in: cyanobacteria)]MBE9200782.1 hypothetical protein [Nodularia sp. LEGE 06071]MCC2693836.1 hypothetical protein [Nodularia sp. LEGE 04288]
MTELLQRVIAEIQKLPEEEQNAIATRLLDELKDEQGWKIRFQATTANQWDNLADMVRQEIASGEVTPLDEVFPPSL